MLFDQLFGMVIVCLSILCTIVILYFTLAWGNANTDVHLLLIIFLKVKIIVLISLIEAEKLAINCLKQVMEEKVFYFISKKIFIFLLLLLDN